VVAFEKGFQLWHPPARRKPHQHSKRQTKLMFGCGCAWTALTSGVGHFSVQMVTLDQVR